MVATLRGQERPDHLEWKRTKVDGRRAYYGVAGQGMPVLFLHGWGLGHHSYKRALKRLVAMGCRVYAPALPGFGGSADLPGYSFTYPGYAAWVREFCVAVGIHEPVFLVGHSFGGGVCIQVAHDYPDMVRSMVLINSVGGTTQAQRPLWEFARHAPSDFLAFGLLSARRIRKALPILLEDAFPNAVRNPCAFWRVGMLARRADLRPEVEALKQRGTPVVIVWGKADNIVPRASFDALCEAIGRPGQVVDGNHSWLLADPEAFGEVMTNVTNVAELAKNYERAEAAALN